MADVVCPNCRGVHPGGPERCPQPFAPDLADSSATNTLPSAAQLGAAASSSDSLEQVSTPPAAPVQSLIGRTLARQYRIIDVIRRGGMGVIYRAHQITVNREVAIKVLRREFATSREVVRRFDREAAIISRLRHPNTLRLLDCHRTSEGDLYIVTELLQGRSLTELLDDGPIDCDRAINIIAQACGAIAEAHANGIVHRDIKPDNIFLERVLDDDDVVKVLDFGVAKLMRTPEQAGTLAGALVGTPAYMSPEQAVGQPVDHRSDIYSLGVVLYHLLTGAPPFVGDSPVATMYMHANVAPKSFAKNRTYPGGAEAIEDLVLEMLAKNPDDRPQSILDVRDRLLRSARQVSIASPRRATKATAKGARSIAPPRSNSERQTAPALTIDRVVKGQVTGLRFDGTIDEHFNGTELARAVKTPTLIADVGGLQRVSSIGIGQWQAFMKAVDQRTKKIIFVSCSPAFIHQLNMVMNFVIGKALIYSVQFPYACTSCESNELVLKTAEDGLDGIGSAADARQCAACGQPMELDDEPGQYLREIVRRGGLKGDPQLRPFLSAQDTPAQAEPIECKRYHKAHRTYVRLEGILNPAFAGRRFAEGLEGEVVVDVRELISVDERGVADLFRFLALAGASADRVLVYGCPVAFVTRWRALMHDERVMPISCVLPLLCARCGDAQRDTLDFRILGERSSEREQAGPPCSHCNGPTTVAINAQLRAALARLEPQPVSVELAEFITEAQRAFTPKNEQRGKALGLFRWASRLLTTSD